MKRYVAGFIFIAASGLAQAQFIGPGTPAANDMIRTQRWQDNAGANGYYIDACDADGSTVWDDGTKLEACANFPAYMEIDKSGTPWKWKIVGYEDLVDDFAIAQTDITTLLGLMADLENDIDALETAFADKQDAATAATDSELTAGLAGKFDSPAGTTAQYIRGDGSLQTFPSIPAAQVNSDWSAVSGAAEILNKPTLTSGTVTSITAGTGLSGGVITSTGTISLPDVGTPGTYSTVTTDTQGRISAGLNRSFAAPSRSLATATNQTGFQISSTRDAYACYEGVIQTTSSIGGPASGSVFLETADTNSTTPGDWTTVATQTASNTITLAVALQSVDGEPWSLCRLVPAGKYVRVRSATVSGTVSTTINATQQEVLL